LALLVVLLAVGSFLAGMMAGPWSSWPFAVAVAAVGLPTARAPGARGPSLGLTTIVLLALVLGATAVASWPAVVGGQPPIVPISWDATRLSWGDCLPIVREFPALGTGFGTFGTIHAYFKAQDLSDGATASCLARFGVEAGLAGLALLGLAALWSLYRLPRCLKLVGFADRALAHGLLGAMVGLGLWSTLSWTVELPAVAISASALGGTWNRWMAGGTDLFVEQG
jgi:hypothetical protein